MQFGPSPTVTKAAMDRAIAEAEARLEERFKRLLEQALQAGKKGKKD